jgi:hypothetical protein
MTSIATQFLVGDRTRPILVSKVCERRLGRTILGNIDASYYQVRNLAGPLSMGIRFASHSKYRRQPVDNQGVADRLCNCDDTLESSFASVSISPRASGYKNLQ